MPHEIRAAIVAPLPDSPKEMAGSLALIADAWSKFLEALGTTSTEAQFTVAETRSRPAANGAKRGRKPRAAAAGGLATYTLGEPAP